MTENVESAGSHEVGPALISRDEWLAEYRAKVAAEEIRTGWVRQDEEWPGLVNRIDIPRKFDRFTEEQKYQRAATLMKNTYDLAAPGAVFFGRANVREHSEIPLSIIRKGKEAGLINWRYLPPQADVRKLLNNASGTAGRGFQIVSEQLTPHAYGEGEIQDPSKGERLGEYRLSFVATKI